MDVRFDPHVGNGVEELLRSLEIDPQSTKKEIDFDPSTCPFPTQVLLQFTEEMAKNLEDGLSNVSELNGDVSVACQKFLSNCMAVGKKIAQVHSAGPNLTKSAYLNGKRINHQLTRTQGKISAIFEKGRRQMQIQLQVAEKKNVAPQEITLEEIEEELLSIAKMKMDELQKKADAEMQKLIFSEKKNRKSKGKPNKKKAIASTNHSPNSSSAPNKEDTTRAAPFVRPDAKSLQLQYSLDLHQVSSLKPLSRITRWHERDPEKIRQFTDRDADGKITYKYEKKSDEAIGMLRAKHHLPGVASLLNKNFRRIYTFPTDRGCGILAELEMKGKTWEGVIYFGIDQNRIYHQYFEETSFTEHNALFVDKVKAMPDSADENEWTSPSFEIIANGQGELRYHYENEIHSLRVYPARPDLLDPTTFPDACRL